jgi:hypothetical protein
VDPESHPLTLDQAVALLADQIELGDTVEAPAALTALVAEHGALLDEERLRTLARLDPRLGAMHAAIEREMRRRGIWRSFRRAERRRVWLGGLRWSLSILLIAAALLAAFFGAIIGASRALHWLRLW